MSTTPTAVQPPNVERPSAPAKSAQELRAEVEQARERLASTVGEIGGAIDNTRNRIVHRAKVAAPVAAAVVGSFIAYKLLRRIR